VTRRPDRYAASAASATVRPIGCTATGGLRRKRRMVHRRERKRCGDEWSPEQTARLRQHWAEGASRRTLAIEFNTTPDAVDSQARRDGLESRRWPGRR